MWILYFVLKVGMHLNHWGQVWVAGNAALWAVLVWPMRNPLWHRLRTLWAVSAAVVLLAWEWGVRSVDALWGKMVLLAGFDGAYLAELASRLVSPERLWWWALAGLIYAWATRYLRWQAWSLGAVLSVALLSWVGVGGMPTSMGSAQVAGKGEAQDAALASFYAQEARREVVFSPAQPRGMDVLVLHVCSLSWDDLAWAKATDHPLWRRFDVVFSQFNSGASYSGAASLRVLQGTCGQRPHSALYDATQAQCYVFPQLNQLGYQVQGLLNHDGRFDDFAGGLAKWGGLSNVASGLTTQASVSMKAFDGSPIRNDFDLLSRWWQRRLTEGDAPHALYYNTVTLHDGNQWPGASSTNSQQTYVPRLNQFLADMDRFLTLLAQSGRPVAVVFLPEHGASLRGDDNQIAGMREIPDPKVTLVPAAIKWVGVPLVQAGVPQVVREPSSYVDLYGMVNEAITRRPTVSAPLDTASLVQVVQGTPFVSSTQDVLVMRDANGALQMRTADGVWLPY